MNINPCELTETTHGLLVLFDTPHGRGLGYWMSGAINLSEHYAVEFTIDDHFILGRNLFATDEKAYRISVHDQTSHIQGRVIRYQDIHLLEIGAARIMIELDQDYDDQWITLTVPATSLKIYDCQY